MSITVTTQKELDAALASDEQFIIIDSPAGVWLEVRAYGSATVRAYGSATVRAYGSVTVRAYDSATVRAYGSATVRAYDSATVSASGSATVRAYDSATVSASKYVAVHLHSQHVTVDGGVVIDVKDIDLEDPATWIEYHGVTVVDGKATVYKAVDGALNAGHNHRITNYPIGGTISAPDWKPNIECGNGLHFGFTPHIANGYYTGQGPARFLECVIDVDSMVALGDKCKAETVTIIREVTIDGAAVTA